MIWTNQSKHIFHNLLSCLFRILLITDFSKLEIVSQHCLTVSLDYQLTILTKYLLHLINHGFLMKYLIDYEDKNVFLLISHLLSLCIFYLKGSLDELICWLNLRHISLLYHDNLQGLLSVSAIFYFFQEFKILFRSIFYEVTSFYFIHRIFSLLKVIIYLIFQGSYFNDEFKKN